MRLGRACSRASRASRRASSWALRVGVMDPLYNGSYTLSSLTCQVFALFEKFRGYGVSTDSGRGAGPPKGGQGGRVAGGGGGGGGAGTQRCGGARGQRPRGADAQGG